MSVGVYSWSTTASSNGGADDNINFAEGMQPAALNNSARAMMAAIKAWGDALGGGITYGGSGNAYTATNNAVGAWSAYTSGQVIALKANHTNSGAATLNVDGLGTRSIVTADGGALASGDLVSGGIYLLAYDGTNFQVLNTIAGGSYQPLDATLTALAALSYTSGELFLTLTAADTFALRTITTAGRDLLDDADAAAQRATLSLGSAAIVNTGTSGATIPLLNGNNTYSGTATFTGQVTVQGTSPDINLSETDAAADEGNWDVRIQAGVLRVRCINDANTLATDAIAIDRTDYSVIASITFGGPILTPAGSFSAPSQSFSTDPDTGWYSGGSNNMALAQGGSNTWQFNASGNLIPVGTRVILGANGTAAAPFYAFSNDADCGWYRIGTDNWAGSVGGSKFMDISSTAVAFDVPITGRILDSSETSGSLTSASRNRRVICSGGVTLPSSGMTSGDFILIDPAGTARTITRPAAHTMYVRDTDVASDDSYAHQIVVAIFHGSSKWTLHGLP